MARQQGWRSESRRTSKEAVMKSDDGRIAEYGRKLLGHESVKSVADQCTVIVTVADLTVWDYLVFLPDGAFGPYCESGGVTTIDDHDHDPWVFVRIMPESWIAEDFDRRLPIALWIYSKAIQIHGKGQWFTHALDRAKKKFETVREGLIRRKYLELRTERHSLRRAVQRTSSVTTVLIKTAFLKLGFELLYLSEGKPYPYRERLAVLVGNDTKTGTELGSLAERFIDCADHKETIKISEKIIQLINRQLLTAEAIETGIIDEWWLFLD